MTLPRAQRRRGRRWWLVGAAVVVVAGLGLAAWLIASPSSAGKPAGPRWPQLSGAEAKTLATQLAAQNPADVLPALAAQVRPAFQSAPSPLVPSGDTLTIDTSTFQVGQEPGYGTVTAKAAGPQPGTFLVFLVRENGSWHVLGTAQQ